MLVSEVIWNMNQFSTTLFSTTLKRMFTALCAVLVALSCAGCVSYGEKSSDVPAIPQRLERNADGVPMLKVYDSAAQQMKEMDLESYVMGVVAGEMRNDWPIEALKAQAILARTFTMNFLATKKSGYADADISTDVREAQAYNAEAVNDRIREAVNETRGIVMAADGEFTQAWFHAHSGGKTELPTKALEYSGDPAYLRPVDSPESEKAPEEVKRWTADFAIEDVIRACGDVGVKIAELQSFEIGERGPSGRAVNFLVNGKEVSAPSFRLQIGASKLKSTLIESVTIDNSSVIFTGNGFGHGVGMSQWGAYGMAEDGKDAEEIIEHYYSGVDLMELW